MLIMLIDAYTMKSTSVIRISKFVLFLSFNISGNIISSFKNIIFDKN